MRPIAVFINVRRRFAGAVYVFFSTIDVQCCTYFNSNDAEMGGGKLVLVADRVTTNSIESLSFILVIHHLRQTINDGGPHQIWFDDNFDDLTKTIYLGICRKRLV